MPSARPIVSVGLATGLKWRLFRLLERLSDMHGDQAAQRLELQRPGTPTPSIWVFVSTIGELNAIDPFLRQLVARLGALKLVLITDHAHYRASYQARFPDAQVCVTRGHGDQATELARHYPARLLVVAEIPCLPSDAPCRFSFAFLLEAKRCKAPAILVNGWLYHDAPACRMDAIERSLFQGDYLRAFDVICVQTGQTQQQLIAAGASPDRVAVTGNIKFDAMQRADWAPSMARSPRLLAALLASRRPIVVAGGVTNLAEQDLVLDAFVQVRARHRDALLVLAPRHPEVRERMQALAELLGQRDIAARFRSGVEDAPLAADVACLVLDTIGDLRDFYAAATIAHVGLDHNVLEPLAFGKPVTVTTGWKTGYPSYPVYRMLLDEDALAEATDAARLSGYWTDAMASKGRADARAAQSQAVLERARGAVARHFAAIDHCLEAVA
jgi:3-deoxy-D-manno-octulosonic-acid transferase